MQFRYVTASFIFKINKVCIQSRCQWWSKLWPFKKTQWIKQHNKLSNIKFIKSVRQNNLTNKRTRVNKFTQFLFTSLSNNLNAMKNSHERILIKNSRSLFPVDSPWTLLPSSSCCIRYLNHNVSTLSGQFMLCGYVKYWL